MLPKACRWLEIEGAAYLRYNYATVASVRPCGGRFEVCIRWGGRDLRAMRGSMERGRMGVERWVEHAKGFPGPCKRR